MINLNAFHDYDIRGIYPTEINEDFFYVLGRALATYIGVGPIAVGHDMRLSSPALYKSLIDGITTQGIDVVALGQISTEMHYFASGKYGFAANIVVSASHNPPEFNGAKIVKANVVPLHGSYGLNDLKSLMEKNEFADVEKKGSVSEKNIFAEWVSHALAFIDQNALTPMKVVVDAGNGMGGPAWAELIKRLPMITFIPLYLDPDGTFPHHLADPLKDENVADLKQFILDNKADFGIALDGDADRVFFFDEHGDKLSGTVTTAILADHFLQQKNDSTILYGAICGRVIPEIVAKAGGTAIRTRVGHSFIKEKMKETKAVFAGEHSGHFYFGSNYNADSSLIAGLIMMQIISRQKKSLSTIARCYDIYPSLGEHNFVANDIPSILAELKTKYISNVTTVDELDGLSFWYEDHWFNVRASKTEPLLRLNVEANTHEILDKVSTDLIGFMQSHGASPK